jgi:hypothetical protein
MTKKTRIRWLWMMVDAASLLDTSTTVEAAALKIHRMSVSKMVQFRE